MCVYTTVFFLYFWNQYRHHIIILNIYSGEDVEDCDDDDGGEELQIIIITFILDIYLATIGSHAPLLCVYNCNFLQNGLDIGKNVL